MDDKMIGSLLDVLDPRGLSTSIVRICNFCEIFFPLSLTAAILHSACNIGMMGNFKNTAN